MARSDFKERNEKIAIRRQAGATLLGIAVEFGITKERVRKILSELCGGTECKDFITSNEAGRLLGFSGSSIRRWIGLGVIKCIKGGNRYLVYREDLPLLKESLQERMVKRTTSCEICGKPVLLPRRMYCSDRCKWRAKYRRRRSDPDKAKKQDQIIRKWQKEHIDSGRFAEEQAPNPD